MKRTTIEKWDEAVWQQAEGVYFEAFQEHGRKSVNIVRRMLDRDLCDVHVWSMDDESIAMAITAYDYEMNVMIIDYLDGQPLFKPITKYHHKAYRGGSV